MKQSKDLLLGGACPCALVRHSILFANIDSLIYSILVLKLLVIRASYACHLVTMGKGAGLPKKSKKAIKKDLPFDVDDPSCHKPPRSTRDKQRTSIIAGLKHLGAPVDTWWWN